VVVRQDSFKPCGNQPSPAARPSQAAARPGDYETLRESPHPLYFLLRVECSVLARGLGCPVGGMVLRSASSLPRFEPELNQILPSIPSSVHQESTKKIAVTADAPSLEVAGEGDGGEVAVAMSRHRLRGGMIQ